MGLSRESDFKVTGTRAARARAQACKVGLPGGAKQIQPAPIWFCAELQWKEPQHHTAAAPLVLNLKANSMGNHDYAGFW